MKRKSFVQTGIGVLLIMAAINHTTAKSLFLEREVNFQNESVELSGTLILPANQNSSPAIVFLHGSGPQDRTGFRSYAEEFAKLGISSLFFDKRGTGSSGGSWMTSSMKDLAEDGLSAVEFLKQQEEINPERIGFWGISQAGWVAPLAASMSDDIAFMIINSGGGASPKESEYYSFEKIFEHAGLSENEKVEGFQVVDLYFQYLATGEGRSQLVAQLNNLQSDPNDPLHRLPEAIRVPTEENRANWSSVATYDPISDIATYRNPILILLGEIDSDHPAELAFKKWKEGLEKANNNKSTIMIFPGAGHGIRVGADHNRNAPHADGYMEVQLGWLWKHVINLNATE